MVARRPGGLRAGHGAAHQLPRRLTAHLLLGHRVRVRSSDPEVGSYLRTLFDSSERDSTAPLLDLVVTGPEGGPLSIVLDDRVLGTELAVDDVPAQAIDVVNRRLCFAPGRLLVVHAAVAGRDRVVVLHGTSHAGKSTLVAGLVREGWSYLSDEGAGLDEAGLIHPYPRPIKLRPNSWPLFPEVLEQLPTGHERFTRSEWHVPPSLLGQVQIEPIAASVIVEVGFVPGVETSLTSVSRGTALAAVARQGCNLRHFGQVGLDRLADAIAKSECYRLAFSDLGDAVDALGTVA